MRADVEHELDPKLYAQIQKLSEEGNRLADSGDALGAWQKFVDALDLVPEPQMEWETTTWLLTSIGDMAFQRSKFDQGADALGDALQCPGGMGNVFIHLRKGQCHFELGDMKQAA